MIRRFYVMPLRHGVSPAQVDELLRVLRTSDRFIPGLIDSAAGLDMASPTVVWENSFIDAETYSGLYMVHPYHGGALDTYLMADSPECLTHDIYTTRYEPRRAVPRLEQGIRRLLLMNLPEGADPAALEAIADRPAGMATSMLGADEVAWVSPKGRPWTHVWEQGFADAGALDAYLATRDGIGTASVEGLKRMGIAVAALRIFTYPVAMQRAAPPPAFSPDDRPVFYEITAHLADGDLDAYAALLRDCYDAYVADAGGRLVERRRTVAGGYGHVELRSVWALASMAAYSDVRLRTATDANWARFVRDAMPLVRGGSRRFYTAL